MPLAGHLGTFFYECKCTYRLKLVNKEIMVKGARMSAEMMADNPCLSLQLDRERMNMKWNQKL